MIRKTSLRPLLAFLVTGSLLLAACGGQTAPVAAPEATVDTAPIYTQAAQTIESGFRLTMEARPTETLAPTSTLEPSPEPTATAAFTSTPEPEAATQTPLVQPTATAAAVLIIPTATRGSSGGAVVATATPAVDKADLVSLSPARGLKVQKNASWDMTVTVKNTGGFTWAPQAYALRYAHGDQLASPSEFNIQKEVKPGETYSFVFTLQAPDSAGPKQVYWAFTNSDGRELMWIDFNIEVTD